MASPFGIEHRLKQVEEMLDFDRCDETRIVGIVGMYGIGKTTLATELFNRYKYKFCRCVNFLKIREKWNGSGADRVRKMFLEELLQIRNISDDEATHGCFESKLLSTKVFVVLDDVSSKRQIEVLLGNRNWIKEGSRIVITTRDRTLITELDPNPYVVPRLNLEDGLKYFSFYAVEEAPICNPEMETFLKMSREFVDYARGNPLALRVLGKDLRGKGEAQWKAWLDTSAKCPNNIIQNLLKISYDELSEQEKDAFLDISCFFRSEDEYYARSLLDSGDHESLQSARGITDLVHKFFISISGGCVEMHDLLHTFAMELCSLASCRVSEEKRRLWNGNYIIAALQGKMDTKTVRGISLDMSEVKNMPLNRLVFTNMCNLRYLKLYSSTCPLECEGDCKLNFPDGLSFPLEEVRYLDWLKFPLEELPSDFNPKNLVDLRLPYSKIKQVWKVSKDTPKLKWVDLNNSRMLQTLSGFSKAPNLLRLNLEGCTSLDCLSEEMKTMESLVFLNLRGCTKLRCLPEMNLRSLTTLILSGCLKLREFRLISENIESLYLDGTAIKSLPTDIVKLQRLSLLNLKECKRLESIPECIGKLKALQELVLSGCSNLKSFPNLEDTMESFRVLLLDGTSIEEMPRILSGSNSLSFLRRLSFRRNDVISSLGSDISQLYHLKWLDVKYCKKLRSLSTLPQNLQCLDAHGCISLQTVTSPLALLMPTEDTHSMFIFTNCFKLNEAAKNDIASHILRKCRLISDDYHNESFVYRVLIGTCYPGYEIPPWFSHQAFSSVLEPKLPPHWCDNKFLGLALCAIVSFRDYRDQNNRLLVKCTCEFENLDASCSQFSVPVGGWFEPGNEPRTVESGHVFIGYISWLNIKKRQEAEYKIGCVPTKAKLIFTVTDGTGEVITQCEVVKCGFGLVYEPEDEVSNVVSLAAARTRMNGESRQGEESTLSLSSEGEYPDEEKSSMLGKQAFLPNMRRLRILLLDGTSIKEVPKLLQNPCPSEWPHRGMKGLPLLRHLCLRGNKMIQSLEPHIGQLYHLKCIDLKNCENLASIPTLPPNLQRLNAHGCEALRTLGDPLAFLVLTDQIHSTFTFSNCNKLDEVAKAGIISYIQKKSQLMSDALDRYNLGSVVESFIGGCFPGCEVPSWLSHQAYGSVIVLPEHWGNNGTTGLALCAVVSFADHDQEQNHPFVVKCTYEFRNSYGYLKQFICTVGEIEPRKIKTDHVFIAYTSWLKGFSHHQASLRFEVTDGTCEVVKTCKVLKCGFSLVYQSDETESVSWEVNIIHGSDVEEINQPGETSSVGDNSYNNGVSMSPADSEMNKPEETSSMGYKNGVSMSPADSEMNKQEETSSMDDNSMSPADSEVNKEEETWSMGDKSNHGIPISLANLEMKEIKQQGETISDSEECKSTVSDESQRKSEINQNGETSTFISTEDNRIVEIVKPIGLLCLVITISVGAAFMLGKRKR